MDNEKSSREPEVTPELQEKLNQIKFDEDRKINKKDGRIGPLIAAIIVLLAISATAIIFTVVKKNNPPTSNNTPNVTEEKKELSSLERAELYKKMAILNYANYESSDNAKILEDNNLRTGAFMLTHIPNFYQNQGYTKSEKLYTLLYVLRHHEKRFETIDKNTYPAEKFAKYIKKNSIISNTNDFYEYVTAISADYVANRYEDLFGEKIEHGDSADICGGFNYDKENGLYLAGLNDACGGLDFRSALIHVYNTEVTKDEIKLYVNAVTVYSGDDDNGKATCKVYTDVTKIYEDSNAKVYKDCEMDKEYHTNFKLADDDKDKVQKYIYTFDTDYHFKSIKKL